MEKIWNDIEDLAKNFEACQKTLADIGDETRQHIILEMIRMDYNGSRVPDITGRTNLSRPAVSHHLQILKEAGIVKMRADRDPHWLNSFSHKARRVEPAGLVLPCYNKKG